MLQQDLHYYENERTGHEFTSVCAILPQGYGEHLITTIKSVPVIREMFM